MTDTSPYGTTQNADAARITANQMVGERAGALTENAAFGTAASMSTAPYKPPRAQRDPARIGKCRGKNDTCGTHPLRGGGELCFFHSPEYEKPKITEEDLVELAVAP